MPAPLAPVRPAPLHTAEPTFTIQWLPPFKVVVHNNSWNTFDEVIAVLMRAIAGLQLHDSIGLTYEIHLKGAAVVFVGDVEEAEICASTIRGIGIKVTVEADQ